jgi:hypothetical protein
LLRFPLFFLKDIFWREIYARWVKQPLNHTQM